MIEKTRVPVVTPTDFGISSSPDRRCKTCACHLSVQHPTQVNVQQSLCRRNPVSLMGDPRNPGLSFAPTQPDLVCFDGWRPVNTPPGILRVVTETV